jgi:hypothetical protein
MTDGGFTKMKHLLSFLVIAVSAHAATFNSDGSRSDVQAKIDLASDGDIVTIPAGTFAWDATVTITGKGITLTGAGGGMVQGSSTSSLEISTGSKAFSIDSASVIIPWTAGQSIVAHYKNDPGKTMIGTVTSYSGGTLTINVSSTAGIGTYGYWYFEVPSTTVIQHNAGTNTLLSLTEDTTNSVSVNNIQFIKGTGTGYLMLGNQATGGIPMLISECRFSAAQVDVRWQSNKGVFWYCWFDTQQALNIAFNNQINWNGIQHVLTFATDDWTTASTMGVLDTNGEQNFYIEQCYFINHTLGAVDLSDNARSVFRYNVLDWSAITTHGPDTGPYGVRQYEIYGCVGLFGSFSGSGDLQTPGLDYWITSRGGACVMYDNTLPHLSSWAWGSKIDIALEVQMIRRNAGPYACWNSGYPVPHQYGQGFTTVPVAAGCYYWDNAGSPIIALKQYEPDECGNDTPLTEYIQIDRDYFLSALPGYSPYTYPHPLRSEDTVALPQFSPAPGTYATAQSVTISSTSGATIYYTTDGSTPTDGSPQFSAPISISTTTMLKSFATKVGLDDSAVQSGLYVISGAGDATVIGTTTVTTQLTLP